MGYDTALIKTTTVLVVGLLALITGLVQSQPQGKSTLLLNYNNHLNTIFAAITSKKRLTCVKCQAEDNRSCAQLKEGEREHTELCHKENAIPL